MYKRLLVPLDGSYLAESALPYAEELAGSLGSEITLIHVSEAGDDKYDHLYRLYMEKMVEATRQGAERCREKPGTKSIKVNSVDLIGHIAEQIVDYADNEKVSLIVMATHGQSGVRRWLLGNVATKVVMATERPVLLIRAKDTRPEVHEKQKLYKALVPLDGSKESEAIIPYIEELASRLNAEVVLFQVVALAYLVYSIPGEAVLQTHSPEEMETIVTNSGRYLETVGAELRDRGINTRSEVAVGIPAEAIISMADEIQANVVAMSTHGHYGISRWIFGSTTYKVLQEGNTPLLLVRPQ